MYDDYEDGKYSSQNGNENSSGQDSSSSSDSQNSQNQNSAMHEDGTYGIKFDHSDGSGHKASGNYYGSSYTSSSSSSSHTSGSGSTQNSNSQGNDSSGNYSGSSYGGYGSYSSGRSYGSSGSYGSGSNYDSSGNYNSGRSYGSSGNYSSGSSSYNSGNYRNGSNYGNQNSNSNGSNYNSSSNNQGTYHRGGNGYSSYQDMGSSPKKSGKEKKKKKSSLGKQIVKVICFALIFGVIAGFTMYGINTAMTGDTGTSDASTDGTTSSDDSGFTLNVVRVSTSEVETIEGTDVSDVVAEVMPSIVAVTTVIETTTQDILGRTYSSEGSGAGSGIIFSESDGTMYIITNYHVIEDSVSVSITFSDDSTADAEVLGYSESDDIAVLTLDMSQLSDDTKESVAIAVMGDSDELEVGDGAIAIGNALGYGQSVTTGTISAVDREVSMTDGTMVMIQTDAAINEGNSGGALLNTKGEVIGINSAKLYGDTIEGMGYAIPINTALDVVDDILSGEIENKTDEETAALGILGGTVSDSMVSVYGYPEGVYVSAVYEGSAAEVAGIEEGYIIVGFNDTEITTMEELQAALEECSPGDEVTIDVMVPGDDGSYTEEQTLTTVLGSASDLDSSTTSDSTEESSDDGSNYGSNDDSSSNPLQ